MHFTALIQHFSTLSEAGREQGAEKLKVKSTYQHVMVFFCQRSGGACSASELECLNDNCLCKLMWIGQELCFNLECASAGDQLVYRQG